MHEIVMSLDEAVIARTPDDRLVLVARGSRVGIGLRGSSSARAPAGGRVAVAGRLPHEAAAVTVIDDAGVEHAATIEGEVWMVVVDECSEDLVRYVDARGELVSTAPPGEHLPVTDAHDPCPVCRGVGWVQVEDEGMTLITCGRCGFVVCGMGGPPLDTSGWPRRVRPRSRKRGADLDPAMFAGAPFHIYRPAGTAARLTTHARGTNVSRRRPGRRVRVLEHRSGLGRTLRARRNRDRGDRAWRRARHRRARAHRALTSWHSNTRPVRIECSSPSGKLALRPRGSSSSLPLNCDRTAFELPAD